LLVFHFYQNFYLMLFFEQLQTCHLRLMVWVEITHRSLSSVPCQDPLNIMVLVVHPEIIWFI
jgi:hypothetical protein